MGGAPHMKPSFPLSPVDSYTASAPCLAPRAPSRGVISSCSTPVWAIVIYVQNRVEIAPPHFYSIFNYAAPESILLHCKNTHRRNYSILLHWPCHGFPTMPISSLGITRISYTRGVTPNNSHPLRKRSRQIRND